MKLLRKAPALILILLLLWLPSGCGQQTGKVPGDKDHKEKPAPSTPVAKTADVAVYYLKMTNDDAYLVREVHQIKKSSNLPQLALNELIKGKPLTPGANRVLPPDTKVLGIKIDKGLATVNFSPEVLKANVGASGEALGIASIVNTLTEFPDIQKVSFMVDGQVEKAIDWWGHIGLSEQPFSRNLAVVYEPVIWVSSPTPGETISSPVEISGSARVFEAMVSIRIKDSQGKTLVQDYTAASEGAPGRGIFQKEIAFKAPGPGQGQIEVFWLSMKDGSEQDKVIIPVKWK
ncbi:Gmad2 immunoglobulin-like domain-containing protein [Syntrophomonas wolfei]|uniref:Gmad2 immunoglobulin-like domain-containing protein n=1 Tax=Syntrophomonas wolfei TaxID=863 RepID=UPI0023EFE355|nr:Gmad2 immunoglobulin-like domain-containing protein [Syntrophomonas wolfei]